MNVVITSLAIEGYEHQPVLNQFLRQNDEAKTLAVLLPGQGYTADMPLFYYLEWLALERGWDVLRVDYAYRPLEYHDDLDIRKQRLEERKQQLYADVEAAFKIGLQQRSYERVVFIGKSLGTRAMVCLLPHGIPQDIWNVWFTPLINEAEVRNEIERYPGRTFVAIGSKDPLYDGEYLARLGSDRDIETMVIEGADHSMDISGDVSGSIKAMGHLMSQLDAFLPNKGTVGAPDV